MTRGWVGALLATAAVLVPGLASAQRAEGRERVRVEREGGDRMERIGQRAERRMAPDGDTRIAQARRPAPWQQARRPAPWQQARPDLSDSSGGRRASRPDITDGAVERPVRGQGGAGWSGRNEGPRPGDGGVRWSGRGQPRGDGVQAGRSGRGDNGGGWDRRGGDGRNPAGRDSNRRDWNGRDWNGRDGDRSGWNGARWNDGRRDADRWNDRGWNDGGRNDRGWAGDRGWNRDWRRDGRYDWSGYRLSNRSAYRLPRYDAPYGWNGGYRRFGIGMTLSRLLFAQDYWIGDPYAYRLPDAGGPYRWVRYYNDALLVDTYSGEVVDVVNDIFWY